MDLKKLKEPFKPEDVKFKIQVKPKEGQEKALVVAYVDARLVMERLDEATDSRWTDFYKVIPFNGKVGVECTLTIAFPDGTSTSHVDVGELSGDGSLDDSLKSGYSDALKRAAVKFGIGRELYSLPKMWAKVKGDRYPVIDPAEYTRLRAIVAGKSEEEAEQAIEWSKDQIQAVKKVLPEYNDGMIHRLLDSSELAENSSAGTVENWSKKYLQALGTNKEEDAVKVANEAYKKALKERKNA